MKKLIYVHNFEEKHVLLWYNKNETNDEIIRRKEIAIYWKLQFLFFSFSHRAKIWNAKWKLLPSSQKTFFIETYTIQD